MIRVTYAGVATRIACVGQDFSHEKPLAFHAKDSSFACLTAEKHCEV